MAKAIQHKSQTQGAQTDLKMYKTSKMEYLQIHNFPFKNVTFLTIEYKIYLKILKNFAAWLRFKTGKALRSTVKKISNFSKDNFVKKSLSLSTKRKLCIVLKPNCSSLWKILLEILIMASKAILSCWTLLKLLILSHPTPPTQAKPLRRTGHNQQVDSSLALL